MQETENCAGCLSCTGVHLNCPPSTRHDDSVAKGTSQLGCVVAAAAIDHDDFAQLLAASAQRRKKFPDGGSFVQDRNNEREGNRAVVRCRRKNRLSGSRFADFVLQVLFLLQVLFVLRDYFGFWRSFSVQS